MSQAQRVVIALFVCLVLWLGWLDRASFRQPPTNKGTETYAQQSSTIETADKPPNITDWLLVLFSGLLFGSNVFLWRANNRSAGIAERALIEIERAFVSLEGFIVELSTAADAAIDPAFIPERYRTDPGLCETRCALIPKWKNSGRTATKNMTIQVNWGGPEWPVITIPDSFSYRRIPEPFFIPPGGEELSWEMEIPPAQAIIDWSFNPVGPPPWILIWGRADYEDVFGRRHILEWCRQLRLDRHDGKRLRATFIQWGEYNRSYNPHEGR
jgi:hypothetical protein